MEGCQVFQVFPAAQARQITSSHWFKSVQEVAAAELSAALMFMFTLHKL
jgi:hypothetical protein